MFSKKLSYRKQIIKQLYFFRTLSCTGISQEIGKSIPYTGKLLDELVEQGQVVETGLAESTGGRRPLMFSLRDDMLFIVVVAIDQYLTRIAVLDIRNKCVGDMERLELNLSTTKNFSTILAEKIKVVIERSGIDRKKFAGIGISTPEIVSEDLHNSFLNSQSKSSLGNYISQHTDLPVFVSNDANLIGLAELRFGSAYKRKNAIVINLGWSLGISLILNRELFRSTTHDYTAEFGHLPLFLNKTLCSCGKTGCLETEASLNTLLEKIRGGLDLGKTSSLNPATFQHEHPMQSYEKIINAAYIGDGLANQLFSETGYAIGRGLAILVNLLNPELLVLSGKGSMAGKLWKDPVQSALREHSIPRLLANTELKISSLGYDTELIGAATLVMENFEKIKRENSTTWKKQMAH